MVWIKKICTGFQISKFEGHLKKKNPENHISSNNFNKNHYFPPKHASPMCHKVTHIGSKRIIV